MRSARHLVVFARAPRLGTVKRRLARDIGPLKAWRFYNLTAARLLRRLGADPRWTTWLAVTPDRAARRGRGLWRGRHRLIAQGPGDLGARMGRALEALPPGPVVIVGSDIPSIQACHAAAAFKALGAHDWVIGPAHDGGYWLIGAQRRPALRLPFDGVEWGSSRVKVQTLANLKGQSVALLETLIDVDTGADLARLEQQQTR